MPLAIESFLLWPSALMVAGGSVFGLWPCASFYYIPTPNGALGGKMKIWYFFIEGAYFGIFLVEGGAGGIEISRGGGGGYRICRGGGTP